MFCVCIRDFFSHSITRIIIKDVSERRKNSPKKSNIIKSIVWMEWHTVWKFNSAAFNSFFIVSATAKRKRTSQWVSEWVSWRKEKLISVAYSIFVAFLFCFVGWVKSIKFAYHHTDAASHCFHLKERRNLHWQHVIISILIFFFFFFSLLIKCRIIIISVNLSFRNSPQEYIFSSSTIFIFKYLILEIKFKLKLCLFHLTTNQQKKCFSHYNRKWNKRKTNLIIIISIFVVVSRN